jgi:tetratricopeptide (TPR) repeat protein
MSASKRELFSPQAWLQTALVGGAEAVRARTIPEDRRSELLERLVVEIAQEVFADSARAEKLAEACDALAALIPGTEAEGKAVRVRGHMQFARNKHEEAVALYEHAIELFQAGGSRVEEARTMSSGLQSLIYLGRYEQAEAWSAKAQQVFEEEHDQLRLARLHSNRGNILYRQDRYQEALSTYELARKELELIGDARDVASVITNMATVQISMGRFQDALRAYREARRKCEAAGLSRMAACCVPSCPIPTTKRCATWTKRKCTWS